MTNENENPSREKIAEYIASFSYVRYWEGALNTAILSRNSQCRWVAALNLASAIREYKEKVPEDLRGLINIDLGKLEVKISDLGI